MPVSKFYRHHLIHLCLHTDRLLAARGATVRGLECSIDLSAGVDGRREPRHVRAGVHAPAPAGNDECLPMQIVEEALAAIGVEVVGSTDGVAPVKKLLVDSTGAVDALGERRAGSAGGGKSAGDGDGEERDEGGSGQYCAVGVEIRKITSACVVYVVLVELEETELMRVDDSKKTA
jgi:hypothetical protein